MMRNEVNKLKIVNDKPTISRKTSPWDAVDETWVEKVSFQHTRGGECGVFGLTGIDCRKRVDQTRLGR
jgi:hypothetical protein